MQYHLETLIDDETELIANQEEKALYYQLSKKWGGFTDEERRFIWLQTTGAA